MAPRTQGSGIELRGLRAAAEGAAVEARCQGHFVGIDDAVAVLVIPAAHCGGVLLAGDAVIADSHAICNGRQGAEPQRRRSEEHKAELQSLMRISYAVSCLKQKKHNTT